MRFCPLPVPGFLENGGRQVLPHLPLSRGLGGGMVAGACWWGAESSSLPTPNRGGTWLYQLYCHRKQAAIRHGGRESEPVTRLLMITHPPAALPSVCLCARPCWEPPEPASRAPWQPGHHGSPSPDPLRARGPGTRREEEGSFRSRGEGNPCWGLGGALRFLSDPESGLLSVLLRVRGACAVLAARGITDLRL